MKFTSTVALMACMLAASGLRVEAKRRVGMDCPMFMVPRCKDGEVYGKKQWGNIPNCYQTICVKPQVIELGRKLASRSRFQRRRMFRAVGRKRYTADQRRCKHLKKMYTECRQDCSFILPGGNCGKHINKYKRIATKPCGRWEKLRPDQGSNSMQSCKRTCKRNHEEAQYC